MFAELKWIPWEEHLYDQYYAQVVKLLPGYQ